MANLSKREIIIIIAMIFVVFYGACSLLGGAKMLKNTKDIDQTKIDGNINGIASDLMKNPLDLSDEYIVGRAEADWGKSPFWEKGTYAEWGGGNDEKSKDDPAAKIVYSGYVDTGQKKMAVINGLEYSVGEKLEIEGYVLRDITARKVVLSNKNSKSELEVIIQD
ncbi:MAG: hypothetical protein ABFD66_05070 [Smithella sp.]